MTQQNNASLWRTVQVEGVLLDKVERYVGTDKAVYTNKSDFVSSAVRKELEFLGVIKH